MVMKSQSPLTQVLAPPHSIIPRVGTGAEKESLCRVVPFFSRFIVRVKVGEKLANAGCSKFNVKDCVLQVAYMSPA